MSFFEGVRKLKAEIKKWTWHHLTAFVLTFFLCALLHACRKSFSNIKDTMEKSLTAMNNSMYPYNIWQKEHMFDNVGNANVFLGELDFLFLLAYSIGLYFSGYIGDRVNLRYMLSIGMCGSALLTFAFGYLSVVFKIHNKNYFRATYFLNGLFQSTGWPVTITIIGNWFSKSSGGLVFGLWSSNASLGNIAGSLIVACVIDYGYEYGILLNSFLLFCGSGIIFFCLIPHPNDIGLQSPDGVNESIAAEQTDVVILPSEEEPETYILEPVLKSNKPKAIGFIQACLLPGVLLYALSYACLKMVNYSFFFWLPTYLSQGLHWDDKLSDRLSNFYDIGGILGGIVAGVITDLMGIRSPIVCLMLFLSMISIYLYSSLGGTYIANVILMIITGFLVGGPANIIPTAITADLGKQEKVRGSTEALATVTGIIDGTGSAGAAIGQYLVGIISKYGGWKWVFYFLVICTGFSVLLIIPILIKEMKSSRRLKQTIVYSELLENYDIS